MIYTRIMRRPFPTRQHIDPPPREIHNAAYVEGGLSMAVAIYIVLFRWGTAFIMTPINCTYAARKECLEFGVIGEFGMRI